MNFKLFILYTIALCFGDNLLLLRASIDDVHLNNRDKSDSAYGEMYAWLIRLTASMLPALTVKCVRG